MCHGAREFHPKIIRVVQYQSCRRPPSQGSKPAWGGFHKRRFLIEVLRQSRASCS